LKAILVGAAGEPDNRRGPRRAERRDSAGGLQAPRDAHRQLRQSGRGPRTAARTGDPAEELARLEGDIAIGGPGLAATLIERGLVDEFRMFVNPVVVGGGRPFFPALDHRIDLELVDTRTFGSRVKYARYRRAD
jgi:dihydrofolate reductase